jgi:hypothetical protein
MDLTGLRVTDVHLPSGVAPSRFACPRAPASPRAQSPPELAKSVEIPTGVAADIHVSGGIDGRDVDRTRFQSPEGGHYRSHGYDTAANRVELHAILGVGQLTIN